ncbi:MAG: hypothetical protein AVDCRST_MAG11-3422 [uncultured Gemmatimonadaceae bacterium]|uniref:TonB-dependent receptor n=1 Tax=uncultured Gemmatimonadaceae bacterium TaxID=246130 RepID=A0A6J4M4B6_9BACT|nr:MAG: hypothetical protein AVDCRST_MAG11-3422 [uncultured Gemmatimonadaceae bacterium]
MRLTRRILHAPAAVVAVGAVVALGASRTAAAQGTATVSGVVRAQSGRPLAGASVALGDSVAAGAAAQTSADGGFALAIPAGARATLTVRRSGFVPLSVEVPALAEGGRREVAVVLSPLAQLDVVTVVAQPPRPLINTEDAATGGSIERAELQALPTDARDPVALAYTIPGVAQATGFFGDAPKLTINGANSLYTQYSIDGLENNEGFLGGPRVEFPLAALQRLDVFANSYSGEFGRSSNGVVNYVTRAGTNVWGGEAFVYNRPGQPIDARSAIPLSADQQRAAEGFRRSQLGLAGGGPLVRDRTFVFGALEYTNENEDRITSTPRATFTGRELRETYKAFARVDHGWGERQSSTLRFALSNVNRAGEGSGIVAPEADVTLQRVGSVTSLTHRVASAGGRVGNETSVQLGTYRWNYPPTRSDFGTPQVTILAPDSVTPLGVVGSSNFVFDETELQGQLKHVLEARLGGAHTLRVGGDVARSSFTLRGSNTNPAGSYAVINRGDIPLGADGRYRFADIPAGVDVLRYQIDAAQAQVDLTQTLYGAFVEDRWRLSPALTVQAGLRWDYDDLTSRGESSPDLNNVQPRVSFNWNATPRSVVRGGVGLYAGKFPYAIYSDAQQFGPNGNQTVTFAGDAAPAFLQGPRSASVDRGALPPGEIRETFALGLDQPMSRQFSAGYQLQVGNDLGLSLDGVYVDTRNLPRSWDLNACPTRIGPADTVNRAPAAGGALACDALRPDGARTGSYRRRTTSESGGIARYAGLYTEARYRVRADLALTGNWVWSHATNNTEDINFTATQGNDFDAEYADAVNDRRHKVSLRAVYSGVRRLTLSGVADYQTGTPVNRVAFGRDLDGSGENFGVGFVGNQDRFFGVPRNGERLPSAFLINSTVAYRVPARLGDVELRADVFNLLNSRLESGFANGIPGGGPRTQVGRPGDPFAYSVVAPPRQFQFSARYAF